MRKVADLQWDARKILGGERVRAKVWWVGPLPPPPSPPPPPPSVVGERK